MSKLALQHGRKLVFLTEETRATGSRMDNMPLHSYPLHVKIQARQTITLNVQRKQ